MKHCIVCQGAFYHNALLHYKDMPASAQNIPTKEELSDEQGIDLELHQCKMCGLIQFNCAPVDYFKDVIRAGGFTSTMSDLRKQQYADFIRKFDLEGKLFLEAGCGQGEFLQMLQEFPVKAMGVEHNPALVQAANEKGLHVIQGFIGSKDDVLPEGPFDAFLSFNYLEHQPDPNGMMQGIYHNLTETGVGIVTVPSFEYIVAHDSFYEFIRDHIAYYTEDTLRFLLEKNGFEVVECQMINRDTISAYVKKRQKTNLFNLNENFSRLKANIDQYVDSIVSGGGKVAVWGAGHQGFTILSTAGLGDKIEYIIDSAPFKQGKYSPATHVPIVPLSHYFSNKVDAIIIVAPGYTDEIFDIILKNCDNDIKVAVLRSKELEILKGGCI